MDFSMFLELHFLLLSLATILLFTWFIVPYYYITDFMGVYGMSEDQGSQMLSVIGIFNTIGMVRCLTYFITLLKPSRNYNNY